MPDRYTITSYGIAVIPRIHDGSPDIVSLPIYRMKEKGD
jgi:hypothetical protein